MEKHDVLVCGPIYTDMIFTAIPRVPAPGEEVFSQGFECAGGGSTYITSVAMARLGMKVGVLAPLGDDFLSSFVKDQLSKEGLSTVHLYPIQGAFRQVTAAFNSGGDRAFVTYQDPLDHEGYIAHLMESLDRLDTKMLVIDARREFEAVIRKAHSKGMCIVLDIGWDDEWIYSTELKELLQLGDWFTPNLAEALAISGENNPEAALDMLCGLIRSPIVKLGSDGAIFKTEDGIQHVPSTLVADPVDTTGAGDNFLGGLLTGVLKGWTMTDAIKLGNYCGARSVQGIGGNATSPTWEQVTSEFEQER